MSLRFNISALEQASIESNMHTHQINHEEQNVILPSRSEVKVSVNALKSCYLAICLL